MSSDREFRDAIQREIEGEYSEEESSPPIHIDAPSEPEVKPEVWKDVESMLFRGFLTLSGDVNGTEFLFKSLNHHEFENIQWLGGRGTGKVASDRFYNTFLSYGVFMIDGENILPSRAEMVPELISFFANLPHPAKSKMIRFLSEVNRRASNAVTLTEAYILEQSSRFKWAQLQGLDLMSATCTGIRGTESLGLNYSQLVWRALNHYEDTRESAEREWDNAKFIGSCFAGKEIQKIYNQDKERRRKEREARLGRRDKLLRQVLLGEDAESGEKGNRIKIVARTVEELAKQLEADLRGEKDWHDEAVERHEAQVQSVIRERREHTNALVRNRIREEGDQEITAYSNPSEGLTLQEVQHRFLRRRQIEAQKAAAKMIQAEKEVSPRLEAIMGKYADSGETYHLQEVVQTNRDPSNAMPVIPQRPKSTPFRR